MFLKAHFSPLVLLLARSSLRQGEREGAGRERNWVHLEVRGGGGHRTLKVESMGPQEVRGPDLLRPSPTPPHPLPRRGQWVLVPASRIQGAGPGTSWLLSSCTSHQPFPDLPGSPRAAPALTASRPRELQPAPTQDQSPPRSGGWKTGGLSPQCSCGGSGQ